MKTCIIVHGGGTRSAFSAGVLYAFSQLGIVNADMLTAISASVPTLAYFTSGQFSFIKEIWMHEIGTEKFVTPSNFFKGEPIFNIDYLIHSVFQKKYPLVTEQIEKSPSDLFIPLYNYIDHKTEFYNNHGKGVDASFWNVLRAALVIHDKNLVGDDGLIRFVDSGLVPFSLYSEAFLDQEDTHYLIINCDGDDQWDFSRWLEWKLFYWFQSKNFPEGVLERLRERKKLHIEGYKIFKEFVKKHRVTTIAPVSSLKMSLSSGILSSSEKIQFLFKNGEETVAHLMKNPEFKNVFDSFAERSKDLSEAWS